MHGTELRMQELPVVDGENRKPRAMIHRVILAVVHVIAMRIS
jgi:hypothetical protein